MAVTASKGWVITGLAVTIAGGLFMKMDNDNRMSAIQEQQAASRDWLEAQKEIGAPPAGEARDSGSSPDASLITSDAPVPEERCYHVSSFKKSPFLSPNVCYSVSSSFKNATRTMEKRWQRQTSVQREDLCYNYFYAERGQPWLWWNFWGGGGNHPAFKAFFNAKC